MFDCPSDPEDWKKGGEEVENRMECTPLDWGTRLETYGHEEAKEIWE